VERRLSSNQQTSDPCAIPRSRQDRAGRGISEHLRLLLSSGQGGECGSRDEREFRDPRSRDLSRVPWPSSASGSGTIRGCDPRLPRAIGWMFARFVAAGGDTPDVRTRNPSLGVPFLRLTGEARALPLFTHP